jgi:hypothetical protein
VVDDRFGRSLQDLAGFLGEVHAAGVDLYLDRQGVDTSTPAGQTLFQQKSFVPKLVINGHGGAEPYCKLNVSVTLQADAEQSR